MEAQLLDLWVKRERASWVQSNFITEDTEKIAADALKDVIAATVELAAQAAYFEGKPMSDDTARKLRRLKTSLTIVAPIDSPPQAELSETPTAMRPPHGQRQHRDRSRCRR